ncbi:hypothetical protein [Trueperella sp.]|uniref:hypothetical protein n=1 Tax=Trueperella sp. TaxID=2699835 RepID=UPI00373684A9
MSAGAFLFLVNPTLAYDPYPDWARWIPALERGKTATTTWNTGNRRHGMEIGDLAVIVKVGVEPRGLVGAGRVASTVVVGPHWNPLAKTPETGYVDLELTELWPIDEPVPLEVLQWNIPDVNWTPRQSATALPASRVEALLREVSEAE